MSISNLLIPNNFSVNTNSINVQNDLSIGGTLNVDTLNDNTLNINHELIVHGTLTTDTIDNNYALINNDMTIHGTMTTGSFSYDTFTVDLLKVSQINGVSSDITSTFNSGSLNSTNINKVAPLSIMDSTTVNCNTSDQTIGTITNINPVIGAYNTLITTDLNVNNLNFLTSFSRNNVSVTGGAIGNIPKLTFTRFNNNINNKLAHLKCSPYVNNGGVTTNSIYTTLDVIPYPMRPLIPIIKPVLLIKNNVNVMGLISLGINGVISWIMNYQGGQYNGWNEINIYYAIS